MIKDLESLNSLNFASNEIKKIPTTMFENLTSFLWLNLSDNNLSQIPAGIKNTNKLIEVYLRDNEITNIPKELGNLNELENLFKFEAGRNNKLASLPENIFISMTNLRYLYLDKSIALAASKTILNIPKYVYGSRKPNDLWLIDANNDDEHYDVGAMPDNYWNEIFYFSK